MTEPAAATTTHAQLGRNAAEHLAHSWPEMDGLTELASPEFAAAAIERLAELIEDQPALFQASRRGSERGAESLSARPFQGIVESIQNGDDLGATELRVALRVNDLRRELLIVHNGAPISLEHVGAMVLPWVSTKADDPSASGRFGIGQKTLRALGGPIDAHCHPYHFRMGEVPAPCPPEPAIDGFYDPSASETLLVVPLDDEVDTAALEQFMTELGTRSLVFLRSIRRVAQIDLKRSAAVVDHQLHARQRRTAPLHIHGRELEVEVVELTDRDRSQTYSRYLVEMPLKADERRHNRPPGRRPHSASAYRVSPNRGCCTTGCRCRSRLTCLWASTRSSTPTPHAQPCMSGPGTRTASPSSEICSPRSRSSCSAATRGAPGARCRCCTTSPTG